MRFIFFISVILLITACNNNAKKETTNNTDTMREEKPIPPVNTDTIFTGLGTEPFWAVYVINNTKIVFQPMDGPLVEVPFAAAISSDSGIMKYNSTNANASIEIVITKQECSDGMSEIVYPYAVELTVNKTKYSGCGRNAN